VCTSHIVSFIHSCTRLRCSSNACAWCCRFQNPVVIILRSDAEGSRFLPPADWTRYGNQLSLSLSLFLESSDLTDRRVANLSSLSVALLIKRWASRFWDFDDLLHSYLSVFVEAQARDSAVSTAVGSPIKVLRDVLASLAENKRRSFIDKRAVCLSLSLSLSLSRTA